MILFKTLAGGGRARIARGQSHRFESALGGGSYGLAGGFQMSFADCRYRLNTAAAEFLIGGVRMISVLIYFWRLTAYNGMYSSTRTLATIEMLSALMA